MDTAAEKPADEKLSRAVRDALSRSQPIRALDQYRLSVKSSDGIVVLQGIVASENLKFVAAQLVRRVTGVKDVVNALTTDDDLERRIAAALASCEVARHHRIAVNVVAGVASLYGAVPTEADAEAIRKAAGSVPDVARVESRLRVAPSQMISHE